MSEATAVISVEDLSVQFGHGSNAVKILHSVDLKIQKGRTVGLVGESGSGKSTLAKTLVGTVTPAAGRICIGATELSGLSRSERYDMRRKVQLIPQDPYSSLNPRRTIGQAFAEAIDPAGSNVRVHQKLIEKWLDLVHIGRDSIHRYPHEFSGGQRQRIAIARALIIEPEVVIADEITSALDVLVQAEILELIARLRTELNLTMLFISHNLAVVRDVCDEVVVMRGGEIVEYAETEALFTAPQHAYTQALLAAVPGSPEFSLD